MHCITNHGSAPLQASEQAGGGVQRGVGSAHLAGSMRLIPEEGDPLLLCRADQLMPINQKPITASQTSPSSGRYYCWNPKA